MAETGRRGGSRNHEELEVLKAIWGEMKALNARLDRVREELGARIDQTNVRLDGVRHELKDELDMLCRRVVESEVRLATATTGLALDVKELSGLIREWREEHRADRAELRVRVSRIEQHLGLT